MANKVAIVTGAGRGIGAAIAKELAADGARVVVNYATSEAEAANVVTGIKQIDGSAAAFKADIRNVDELDDLFSFALETFGRLDVLVNNAGVSGTAQIENLSAEAIDETLGVNVRGMLLASQRAAAAFDDEGGVIVNVSSMLSREPFPGEALYAASKAAVEAVTRVLAQELGRRAIRVNAVAPGSTETDLLRAAGLNDELKGFLASRTALGRLGQPEDIAKVVAFLAGDGAKWVTGQVIGADGGLRL